MRLSRGGQESVFRGNDPPRRDRAGNRLHGGALRKSHERAGRAATPQFTIHAAEATILATSAPGLGVVALAILLCGIATGWLSSGMVPGLRHGIQPTRNWRPTAPRWSDSGRLTNACTPIPCALEQALAGDVVAPRRWRR